MRQRPLFLFFLIAFAFSWLLSIPAILSAWGILPAGVFGVFFTLKAFGPLLAAYIMTSVIEGKEGVARPPGPVPEGIRTASGQVPRFTRARPVAGASQPDALVAAQSLATGGG